MARFEYRGRQLKYLAHPDWWATERAVEIPIAAAFLNDVTGWGLEVGNVLAHHGVQPPTLMVVDRDEVADGVVNADIRDWSPERPFDWLVSISTIEHVGWSPPRGELTGSDAIAALDRMRGMVRSGGPMLMTVPFGFNPRLDSAILDGRWSPTYESTMVRDGEHLWHEEPGRIWRPYGDRGSETARSLWVGWWA